MFHKVVVGYRFQDGSVQVALGAKPNLNSAVPLYAEIPGWNKDISSARYWGDLPEACKHFIKRYFFDVRVFLADALAEVTCLIITLFLSRL
jgi:adenylosuccinate synthase